MINIVAIADPHIGANRFGVTAEEWNRPLFEAVEYAIEHQADYFMVAGDVFHSRRPTPDDYVVWQEVEERLAFHNIRIVKVPGNHDEPAAAGKANTLWPDAERNSGVSVTWGDDLMTVRMGWPRPVDFIHPDYLRTLSIDEAIAVTREEVLNGLKSVASKLPADRPAILLGHCMVSYGGVKADDPGLILGKDVVLPAEELRALPALPVLGHVHRPDSLYVGSTQPTDFGEAHGPLKRFWDIRIHEKPEDDMYRHGDEVLALFKRIGNFTYQVSGIPFKTSLRLLDIELSEGDVFIPPGELTAEYVAEYAGRFHDSNSPHDIARARITTSADLDPAAVRKMLLAHAKRVHSVEIVRPQRAVARVETERPLAAMSPLDAFDVWLQDLISSEQGQAARREFERMVTQ